jgi:hypothetical protein
MELCGGSSAQIRAELECVQLLVLCCGLLQDSLIDTPGSGQGASPWDAALLSAQAQRRLSAIFPAKDSFWNHYFRVLREQAESARWESSASARRQRFDRVLLRALGRKAAWLRWPAFAVARLSGTPRKASMLDRLLERLLIAHQLLDDLLDVEDDARSGQPNGVLAAMKRAPADQFAKPVVRAHAARKVCAAARAELRAILSSVPPGAGIAQHARLLLGSCDRLEARAAETARLRLAAEVVAQLAPARAPTRA